MKKLLKLFIVLIYISQYNSSFAQCSSAPACLACSGGNGSAYDGVNINSGNTYWYNGTGTINNINLSGGNLVICGSLTINNINFNQGTIYVCSGGNLYFNTANVPAGGSLVNYGSVSFSGNVVWQGSPSMVYNATSASTFNVSGNMQLNNNSQFINNGVANISNFNIQTSTAPSVCLGLNGIINTNTCSNNTPNSIISPSGLSCIFVNNNANTNSIVTSSSNLQICLNTGAYVSNPSNWGSATVYNNCASCSYPLPIDLVYFDIKIYNTSYVKCVWQTASEINNDYFEVQKSIDGINFETFAKVKGAGFSNQVINYSQIDNHPYIGISYYRLKQVDFDGTISYSQINAINFSPKNSTISFFPNPTKNHITISNLNENEIYTLKIFDVAGNLIEYKTIGKNSSNNIDLTTLSNGFYTIHFFSENELIFVEKLVKE